MLCIHQPNLYKKRKQNRNEPFAVKGKSESLATSESFFVEHQLPSGGMRELSGDKYSL